MLQMCKVLDNRNFGIIPQSNIYPFCNYDRVTTINDLPDRLIYEQFDDVWIARTKRVVPETRVDAAITPKPEILKKIPPEDITKIYKTYFGGAASPEKKGKKGGKEKDTSSKKSSVKKSKTALIKVPDYSAVRENFDPYAEEYIPHKVSESPMDELIEEDVHEEDSWQSLQASSRSSSTQSRRNYYYENYLIVYTYLSKAIDAMVDALETMREITPCVSKDFDRVLVCEDIQLPLETTETGIHEHVQWQQEGEQEIEYKRDSEDEDYYKYLLNMNLYENENVQSYLLEGNKSIPPNIEAEITREAAQKTAKEVIDIMLEAIPSRSHHTLYSVGAQTSFESFDVNKDLKHLTSMRQSLDLSEMEQYILDNKESYDMFYFMDSCGE